MLTFGRRSRFACFLLYADRYEAEQLRELLPGGDFHQAVTIIEAIASRTKDRTMYDQREKAQREHTAQPLEVLHCRTDCQSSRLASPFSSLRLQLAIQPQQPLEKT
jgi:hypothetical protein